MEKKINRLYNKSKLASFIRKEEYILSRTLFKLAISATDVVNTYPTVSNYFYKMTAAYSGTAALTISAGKFLNDNNSTVTSFTEKTSQGYYLLFVNGVLQQTNLYTVASLQLTINTGTAISLLISTPITLTTTNFVSSSALTINT